MPSNIKETKIAFESLFHDNWLSTPIHYSGIAFDSSGYEKWINIVYEPSGGAISGLGDTPNITRGMFYIVCWAKDEFDSHELGDSVIAFMFNNPIVGITLSSYDIADSGYDPNGRAFVVLAFPIKSYLQCN